ncbi:DUF5681 domain-containing protein [Ruegeria meonggei]|uniref:DUF5681 domain-containing protein n=1 Tax=Ruegeria meonggei TaxID=1446476 RepID=UPI00366CA3F0
MSDHEIGYGRPPKATQFKKGKSGNPKGRPRKTTSLNAIVKKAAARKVSVQTAQGSKRISKIEALADKTINDALKGDARARTEAFRLLRAADMQDELAAQTRRAVENLGEDDRAVLASWEARLLSKGVKHE